MATAGNDQMNKICSCIGVLALITSLSPVAAPDSGFLVIDSILSPQAERQPTWIALRRYAPLAYQEGDYPKADCAPFCIHVPVGTVITSVPTGRYSVDHIDFRKSKSMKRDSLQVLNGDNIAFEIGEKHVTVLGLIHIERVTSGKHQIQITQPRILLQWACDEGEDIFDRYQAHIVDGRFSFQAIKVKCSDSYSLKE